MHRCLPGHHTSHKHDRDSNQITQKSSKMLLFTPAPKAPNSIGLRLSLMNISDSLPGPLRFTSKAGLIVVQAFGCQGLCISLLCSPDAVNCCLLNTGTFKQLPSALNVVFHCPVFPFFLERSIHIVYSFCHAVPIRF